MFLITCGVLVAFIDHAGVYILKLCPWCSLDLQDKLKQLPVLTLLAGQVFYYSSLGQQFGAVTAWEMFGVGFVVPILIPSLLYMAFQKRKTAVADGSLLMPLCEDNVPTPTNRKQTSIGNLTGLNFAMESATAVWDPNSTAFPSSQAQSQVALTYLPFALAHTFTDVGILIFMAMKMRIPTSVNVWARAKGKYVRATWDWACELGNAVEFGSQTAVALSMAKFSPVRFPIDVCFLFVGVGTLSSHNGINRDPSATAALRF